MKIHPSSLKHKTNWTDKFDVSHPIYYPFELPVADRRPIPLPKNRFTNIAPEEIRLHSTYTTGKNVWMLKPSWMSRGRGLEIFQTLEELETLLKNYLSGYQARDFSQMKYSIKNEKSPVVKMKQSLTIDNKKQGTSAADANSISSAKAATFPVFIVQKYLERPMLFKSYKFDIRVYACLTQNSELFVFR